MNNEIYTESNTINKDLDLLKLQDEITEDNELENDEIKSIIYKTMNNLNDLNLNDLNSLNNLKKNKNKKINNINNILTLNEFHNKTNEPSKFISKRAEERKKNLEVYKRKFNPRLPPYGIIKNKKIENIKKLDINNIDLFPKLT